MYRIKHLFVLMRPGHGQNLGVLSGDVVRFGPQAAGDNHLAVLDNSFTDGLKALGLGAVEETTGVHNHRIRP